MAFYGPNVNANEKHYPPKKIGNENINNSFFNTTALYPAFDDNQGFRSPSSF